ncbi:hypothetical protein E2C01_067243 [Portunus trituberculatus]|uniref:Uncharacterized protein n=1 Tax=Portunus trituberculatus TaxID=210409 RepID=A0A5B7HT30_PORTR|nr:hypothetical protein [Portunus trituberculatus]
MWYRALSPRDTRYVAPKCNCACGEERRGAGGRHSPRHLVPRQTLDVKSCVSKGEGHLVPL